MNRYFALIAAFLALLACSNTGKPIHSQVSSVLFVGNSLVYYNDLPSLLRVYADSQQSDVVLHTELLAEGGYSLSQHSESEVYGRELASRKYAFVVLQEVGGWPLCPQSHAECAKTEDSLKRMSRIATENGAIPLWLGTWHPSTEAQSFLSSVTLEMGARIGIATIDSGSAIHSLSSLDRIDELLLPDFHPDLLGSWLLAALIYGSMTGEEMAQIDEPLEYCYHDWRSANINAQSRASSQGEPETVCSELSVEDHAFITDAANKALNFAP